MYKIAINFVELFFLVVSIFFATSYLSFVTISFVYIVWLFSRKVLVDSRDPLVIFNQFFAIFVVGGAIIRFAVYDPAVIIYYYILSFWIVVNFISGMLSVSAMSHLTIVKNHGVIFKLALSFFLFMGFLASIIYYLKIGFIPAFSALTPEQRIGLLQGNGYLLQLMRFGVYAAILYSLYNQSRFALFIFLFALAAMAGVGFRGQVLQFFLIYLLSSYVLKSSSIKFGSLVILFFGFVFSSFSLGVLRVGAENSFGLMTRILHDFSISVYNFDFVFSHFDDFQYGATILFNFSMFAPGANIDYTQWLTNSVGMNFSGGITPTIIGEGYINFGKYLLIHAVIVSLLLLFVRHKLLNIHVCTPSLVLFYVNSSVLLARSVTGGVSNMILDIFLSGVFIGFFAILHKIRLR